MKGSCHALFGKGSWNQYHKGGQYNKPLVHYIELSQKNWGD
jgi:hypothetical protein